MGNTAGQNLVNVVVDSVGATFSNAPLGDAITQGDLDAVVVELDAHPGWIDQPLSGMMARLTPLHQAVRLGHLEIVELLLSRGCRTDIPDVNGMCPIHYAASRHAEIDTPNRAAMVRLLAGSVDVQDNKGMTPLHRAAGLGDLEVMETLIELGCRVNVPDATGNHPLHYLVARHESCAYPYKDGVVTLPEMVTWFLGRCTECNPTNLDNVRPSHLAIVSGHGDIVRLLLKDRLEDVDGVTKERSWCGMHIAAEMGNVEIIRLLLELGSTGLDIPEDQGMLPVHIAALNGRRNAIDTIVLCSRKIVCATSPKFKATTLSYAVESNDMGTLETVMMWSVLTQEVWSSQQLSYAFKMASEKDAALLFLGAIEGAPLDSHMEDEILSIRERVYFTWSLTTRLLWWL